MTMKTLAATTALCAMILGAATASFAKGHDQGFGAQLAGQATAGFVDDNQSNSNGNGSATAYGTTDAAIEAKAGLNDNSEVARDRTAAGHPRN